MIIMKPIDENLLQKLLKNAGNGNTIVLGDNVAYKYVENEIGNIEPGGIGIQINYGDKKEDAVAGDEKEGSADDIPEALATSPLWEKVKQAGWVNEAGQPTVSRPEAALMADALAHRLGISNKWKVFEKMWHRNNMRGDYNTALNQRKSLEFQDELKNILG